LVIGNIKRVPLIESISTKTKTLKTKSKDVVSRPLKESMHVPEGTSA